MGEIADRFAETWRDYVTDGVPASGAHEPVKSEIRAIGRTIETVVSGALQDVLRFATVALMNADVGQDDGTLAYVYANNADPADPANGYYQWNDGGAAWIAAPWVAASLAAVVQPEIDALEARVDEVEYTATAVERIETATGRAALYGISDPVQARLFAQYSTELDFAGSYFRSAFDPLAAIDDLPGWTFDRNSLATDEPAGTVLQTYAVDVPRVSNLGLLVETGAVQAATYSYDFNSWSKTNVTVTVEGSDYAGQSARRVQATAAGVTVLQMTGGGTASADGNTLSAIVKKGTSATVGNQFLLYNASAAAVVLHIEFNYDTGQITYLSGTTGAAAVALGSGWWQITLSDDGEPADAGDSLTAFVGFVGQAAAAGDRFFASHAQIENRPYATSRIVNNTGAPADRVSDTAYATFDAAGDFTVFVEAELRDHRTKEVLFSIDDGSASGVVELYRDTDGTVKLLQTVNGGATTVSVVAGKSSRRTLRAALVSRAGSTRVSVDGGVPTPLTLARPTDLSTLWFGQNRTGSFLNGHVKRLLILQRAATDAEARSMTRSEVTAPLADAPLIGNPTQGRFDPNTSVTPIGDYGLQAVVTYGTLPCGLLIAENRGPSALAIGADGTVLFRDTTHLGRWVDVDPITGLCLVGSGDYRTIRWLDRGGRQVHSWAVPGGIPGELYGVHTNGLQMVINVVDGANGATWIYDLDADGYPYDAGAVFAAFTGAAKYARGMLIDGPTLWVASMVDPVNPQGCEGAVRSYTIATGALVDSYYGHYPNDVGKTPDGRIVWVDEHLDRVRSVDPAVDVPRTVMAGLQVTAEYEPGVSSISANILARRTFDGSGLEAAAVEYRGVNGLYAPNGLAVISNDLFAIADTDNSRVIIARETATWAPEVVAVVAMLNEPTKVRLLV